MRIVASIRGWAARIQGRFRERAPAGVRPKGGGRIDTSGLDIERDVRTIRVFICTYSMNGRRSDAKIAVALRAVSRLYSLSLKRPPRQASSRSSLHARASDRCRATNLFRLRA
ncbi:hypothetical protein NITHO_870005 [Nitrolancea hollandica Lb]|uniref:Uncharacterized protein n=1 Tax=Nitrolancea hollandica Lb TaxID=1129897 RepID=I4ENE2_9BACT|nr:hypothetical protein NITHO_870005 [Nitrolancea hollandica Lb]